MVGRVTGSSIRRRGDRFTIRIDRGACRSNLRPVDLADFIGLAGREPGLRFLIIGGYAVAAHGHTRATFDVDFLARRSDRPQWVQRCGDAGLRLLAESNAFAQFTEPSGGDGFDLMFVEDSTFEGLWLESVERMFGSLDARVPALNHLLALKLHALKQGLAHRTSKDAGDIEMLARRNRLASPILPTKPCSESMEPRKSTTPSCASSAIRDGTTEAGDLVFPEGDPFRSLPPQLSLAEFIVRNRQLREWFPHGIPTPEERWRAKTDAEFIL